MPPAIQAMLGLSIDAGARQICFSRPTLPPFLDELEIRRLHVNDATIDFPPRRTPWHAVRNIVPPEVPLI